MENPWTSLREDLPFVLREDSEPAMRWMQRQTFPDFQALPEPFIGNPGASVVLLNLNPGYHILDWELHKRADFRDLIRGNHKHEAETPFYYLDPRIANTPGGVWWNKRLRELVAAVGTERLSHDLLCVEWYPYHSKGFLWRKKFGRLPSQQYSFHLLREAMKRGALLVAMRGLKYWLEDVPELNSYGNLVRLSNPRSVYISRRNCQEFDRIVRALLEGPYFK